MIPDKIHFAAIMSERVAEVHTTPMPELGPEDLLLEMRKINICTTDYQHWMGLRNHQGFPMAGGHEYAGIIVAKGANVVDHFAIGKQVGATYASCGICPACKRGLTSDCSGRGGRKASADGFLGSKKFANYAVINQREAALISNDIPAEQAGFLEPVATVVQCVKKSRIHPMEDVVVVGAGTMGLVNAQVAKAWGARVIISDIDPKKIAQAQRMGIADVVDAKNDDPVKKVMELTDGKGADCVIAAVGSTIAYKQGYEMMKRLRGRLILFPAGYPAPAMSIDPNEIHYRKIEIIGTFGADMADFEDAATLLSKRLINMSYSLEGKEFALRDIQQAYEAASTPGTYRITVDLQKI